MMMTMMQLKSTMVTIGSFSNDDGDGKEDVKKQ